MALAGLILAMCSGGKAHAQDLRTCNSAPGRFIPGLNGGGNQSVLCVPAQAVVNSTLASSVSTAGTVAVANGFQSVLAANPSRNGCMIVDLSPHTIFVYLGDPSTGAINLSIPIAPNNAFSCASPGGLTVTDQISVTSANAGDAFLVLNQ